MTRAVIINADDYAMDAEVDRAILELGALGVVTATSAMVLSPRWPEAAAPLRDLPLSHGLHLDFTSAFADQPFVSRSLTALTIRTHANWLDRDRVKLAIHKQLGLYEDALKSPPVFVDGHQHVHHLPGVREVLLEVLSHHYGSAARNIALRVCAPRPWRGLKAEIVARTGAREFERLARRCGHRLNSDFAGVYSFAADADLEAAWGAWLQLEGDLPLVMCHIAIPGGVHLNDPIRKARYHEFEWLNSAEFSALLQRLFVTPSRWPPS
jgi:predicted glycoside hydrolase/deacetylase ChbG (UPF0249 family)